MEPGPGRWWSVFGFPEWSVPHHCRRRWACQRVGRVVPAAGIPAVNEGTVAIIKLHVEGELGDLAQGCLVRNREWDPDQA